jgi:hypothetical protein
MLRSNVFRRRPLRRTPAWRPSASWPLRPYRKIGISPIGPAGEAVEHCPAATGTGLVAAVR